MVSSSSSLSEVKIISESFVKPKTFPEKWKEPYHLSLLDHFLLSLHYIQKGLLFLKPSTPSEESDDAIKPQDFMETLLQKLKDSLATTLVQFYPLAGRLSTWKTDDASSYSVFVDCNNSPGAGFIHAKSDLSVGDIVGSKYVPLVVQSFFDHHKAVSGEDHTMSLLSIKVTELKDGVFIGLSMNHALGDGSSFWQFFNSLSEIFNSQEETISNKLLCLKNPPIFREMSGPICSFPFTQPDESIRGTEPPVLKERMFHFSSETMRTLKAKANQECGTTTISSFQSLSAFVWRSITRARKLPNDQETTCRLAAGNRSRMDPPLAKNYFGVYISLVKTTAKVVHMGSSPWFNKYGSEFGMGKAVAVRSGYGNKVDGKVSAYPGREGGGSIDLEVCLLPEFMEALESDQEFMSLVSSS
ncbi:BnaAnng06350D [Brassica napus]|uniref:BnaAnng06350D protein n=1 Tax=Brassica napus TaxID=3708 RepID=A0A078HSG3_BRANA|nr:BnaAnng06350D [Brassica napus]